MKLTTDKTYILRNGNHAKFHELNGKGSCPVKGCHKKPHQKWTRARFQIWTAEGRFYPVPSWESPLDIVGELE